MVIYQKSFIDEIEPVSFYRIDFSKTDWRKEMSYKVSNIIEKDEFGYYAFYPELEGYQTQGDSYEEVIENIREAIKLYLEV